MRMAENASLGGGMRGGGGGGGFDEAGSLFNSWDANGDLSDREFGRADRFESDKKSELGWQLQDGSEWFRSSGESQSDQGGWNRPVAASSEAYPVAGALPMPFYEMKTREIAYTIAKPVYARGFRSPYWYNQPDYTAWLNTLFPGLPEPAPKPTPPKISDGWSADARALVKSLLRTDALQKLAGGLELRRTDDNFDPRWNRRSAHHTSLVLYSPKAWLTRPMDLDGQTVVNYCNDHERGVYSLALLLGRTRKSVERDLATPPLGLNDWSLAALDESYPAFKARVRAGRREATDVDRVGSEFEARNTIPDRHGAACVAQARKL